MEPSRVFERVIQKQELPFEAPSSKESGVAMDEFNSLKYKQKHESDAKAAFLVSFLVFDIRAHSQVCFAQNTYPEPPASSEHLDAQQQALIHEQENELQRMKVDMMFGGYHGIMRLPGACKGQQGVLSLSPPAICRQNTHNSCSSHGRQFIQAGCRSRH